MGLQVLKIGDAPNDGKGDTLRAGGEKIVGNFAELYAAVLAPVAANGIYAGPVSGGQALPGFRALVSADLPGDAGLAGNPTAVTQLPGNSSTRIATTEFVAAAIAGLSFSIPTDADLPGNPTTTTQLPGNSSARIATTAFVAAAIAALSFVSLASANVFTAPQTVQGATTTQPSWNARLTGDGVPRISIGLNATDVPSLGFGPGNAVRDAFIERVAAGRLRFGGPDAAAPVTQISSVQNVVAGTANTAGAHRYFDGSQGTGTGAGGSHIFRVASAGSSGSSQNALQDFVTFGAGPSATLAFGTLTASRSFDISQEWNNAAVAFKTLRFLITDTASDPTSGITRTSSVIEIERNGTSRFRVDQLGGISTGSSIAAPDFAATAFAAIFAGDSGRCDLAGFVSDRTTGYSWTNTGLSSGSRDLTIARDDANSLGLRRLSSLSPAQRFNIYETSTAYGVGGDSAPSIYSRGFIDAGQAAPGVLTIGVETVGVTTAGTDLTKLKFSVAGASVMDYGVTAAAFWTFPQARIRINQTPGGVGTGTKTISNSADSSSNFGHYAIFDMNGTLYYFPCSTVAPT